MPAAHKGLLKVRAHPREAFQGHAGPRVHGRGQSPLHAANAQRQTHRPRRGPDRRGHGRGEIDFETGRGETHSGGLAGPSARADLRSQISRKREENRQRSAGRTGRGFGHVVFSAERAVRRAEKGEKVVLARIETSPEDLRGMIAAEGILTARGGVSSHAALVARQMGKVCVCGAIGIQIDYQKRTLSANGKTLQQGDYISIDGTAGEVFAGEVTTAPSEIVQVLVDRSLDAKESADLSHSIAKLMNWVDEFRDARCPHQRRHARAGEERGRLRRGGHRPLPHRAHVLRRRPHRCDARDDSGRKQRRPREARWRNCCPISARISSASSPRSKVCRPRSAFSIRRCTNSCRTISAQQVELAEKLGVQAEHIARRVRELHEFNPMLGHRGCRLGIVYPEISEMQARAVFEAAAEVQKKGIKVQPEIMIPLVGFPRELSLQIEIVHRVAANVAKAKKTKFDYLVGTMIEIPRAALVADEIARDAEFFSFGTNDLTQTALGMSRDDSGSFLPAYTELDIIDSNPFASIDQKGVGRLMEITRDLGRKTRPEHQARHLRRTRRRSAQREILPSSGIGLRQLQSVSRADCAAGGGTGRPRRVAIFRAKEVRKLVDSR